MARVLDSNLALSSPFFIATASIYIAFVKFEETSQAFSFASWVAEDFEMPNLQEKLLEASNKLENMIY